MSLNLKFGLYRGLLRYAQSLVFSDRQYVEQVIRREFRRSRSLDPQKVELLRRKGIAVLERRNLV